MEKIEKLPKDLLKWAGMFCAIGVALCALTVLFASSLVMTFIILLVVFNAGTAHGIILSAIKTHRVISPQFARYEHGLLVESKIFSSNVS